MGRTVYLPQHKCLIFIGLSCREMYFLVPWIVWCICTFHFKRFTTVTCKQRWPGKLLPPQGIQMTPPFFGWRMVFLGGYCDQVFHVVYIVYNYQLRYITGCLLGIWYMPGIFTKYHGHPSILPTLTIIGPSNGRV